MFAKRLAAALLLGAAALAPVAAAKEPFIVQVDQTTTLKLAGAANSVIVGNATVVDITVADAHTLLVTGKAFGSTNLIVLDRSGEEIYSNTLAVSGTTPDQLTVIRGGGTYSYSCIDKCRPTPMVGDAQDHFGAVMGTVTAKAGAAKGQ